MSAQGCEVAGAGDAAGVEGLDVVAVAPLGWEVAVGVDAGPVGRLDDGPVELGGDVVLERLGRVVVAVGMGGQSTQPPSAPPQWRTPVMVRAMS